MYICCQIARDLILRSAVAIAALSSGAPPALAWGDDGHNILALIAQAFLTPVAASQVNAMLATDPDPLVQHDIASEATWADHFRDSSSTARAETSQWHFVDIEIAAPDLGRACFGNPPIPSGTVASNGPAKDCVVDKINEFAAELADTSTAPEERLVALKFLLHFVGDLHQPLHSSDDHDRGGNNKRVSASGFRAGNLHHFWDTEFVDQLGPDPKSIASDLIGHITPGQAQDWASGAPADWALESFVIARDHVYGLLPKPSSGGSYRLDDGYIATATSDVAMQLSKAGVRLALVLNKALL